MRQTGRERAGRWRFAIAGEDSGHEEATKLIVSAIARESVPWLADQDEMFVDWSFEKLTSAVRRARERLRVRLHGEFGGRHGGPDALMVRAQLLLWSDPPPSDAPLDIGILVRDMDGRARERRGGFQEAIARTPCSFVVLCGLPDPEVEAWVACGFEASGPREQRTLDDLSQELGFSPHTEPERLTSKPNDAPTDAKRTSRRLVGDDPARRQRCLVRLDLLRARGHGCGVAKFVEDLQREVVPILERRG